MIEARLLRGVASVQPAAWDRLAAADPSPFLEHGYLAAVEAGSATPEHGVEPLHVTLWDGAELVAAAPLLVKHDGRGEFLYDHALAQVARRAGAAWYPKAVTMGPFAPFDVGRLLVAPGRPDATALRARLLDEVERAADDAGLEGLHHLFVRDDEAALLEARGYARRLAFQLCWRARGLASFEAWLESLRSKERVRTRRELRRVEEAGLRVHVLAGDAIGRDDLEAMFGFYEDTCARHGTGSDYLKRPTWEALFTGWRRRLVLVLALEGGRRAGGSLLVRKGPDLYGRYWGAVGDRPYLYFTLAFYRPIAWALEQGVERLHAGAGTTFHKYARGFDPLPAWSFHRPRDARAARAVAAYCDAERAQVEAQMRALERT